MRLSQLLFEKSVLSSWISDIKYNRKTKTLYMTLHSGRVYAIDNFSRAEFEKWHSSKSKGKFWHAFVAGFYNVTRVK